MRKLTIFVSEEKYVQLRERAETDGVSYSRDGNRHWVPPVFLNFLVTAFDDSYWQPADDEDLAKAGPYAAIDEVAPTPNAEEDE